MPTYVMLGHGADMPVEKVDRPVLPDGVTLVTTMECGVGSPTELPGHVLEVLKKYRTQANDPVTNKLFLESKLGFKIHVYRPGNPYPDIGYTPEALQRYLGRYYLSGVVNLEGLTDADVRLMQNGSPFTSNTESDISRSFERSAFPNVDAALDTILNGFSFSVVPLRFIFNYLGDGVYYFPLCRSIPDFVEQEPERLSLIRQKSAQDQQKEDEEIKLRRLETRLQKPQAFPLRRRTIGGKRMKKRLTKRRKYGARRTTMRLV